MAESESKEVDISILLSSLEGIITYSTNDYLKVRNPHPAFAKLLESQIHIAILTSELVVLQGQMEISITEYQKRLYARILAVICYQYLLEQGTLIGTNVRRSKDLIILSYQSAVSAVKVILDNLKKDKEKYLKSIRNTSMAHRDGDLEETVNHVLNLDYNEINFVVNQITYANSNLFSIFDQITKVWKAYHPDWAKEKG